MESGRNLSVAALGGGTGLSSLLQGLKHVVDDLTAIALSQTTGQPGPSAPISGIPPGHSETAWWRWPRHGPDEAALSVRFHAPGKGLMAMPSETCSSPRSQTLPAHSRRPSARRAKSWRSAGAPSEPGTNRPPRPHGRWRLGPWRARAHGLSGADRTRGTGSIDPEPLPEAIHAIENAA